MDVVAFGTGAALSVMLGSMQWRVDRAARTTSGYLLLWILGFIWTFGNFLRSALELGGAAPDSASVRFAQCLAWSCTVLGPVTVGRLVQVAVGVDRRISRVFLAVTIGASLLNLGLFALAAARHGGDLEASRYPAYSFYVGVLLGVVATWLYATNRAAGDTRRRWFAAIAVSFAVIHAAAIAASMLLPEMPGGWLAATTLIARHWTIPWSILIAVSLAQVHHADVVLKRSLWLLASVGVAVIIASRLVPAQDVRALVATAALGASMLMAPWLFRLLGRFVDAVVSKRPDYSHERIDQTLRRESQPAPLVDAALQCLRETLRVEARWVEATTAPVPPPLAFVMVTCADAPARRIEITASHQARQLEQPELAFLDAVGAQLGHRLHAIHFEQEQRSIQLREEKLKRLLTEAELKALRTQVDPHFLFNTLNTIAELIATNPAQAERMTERLAGCFRYALAKHSRNLSTLDEELHFARHYLEIEQVRFGERLRVDLSRGDADGSETIPSLLLQPLLENAIRHGLAPMREGGSLSVHAKRDGDRLRLSVADDGVGLRAGSAAGVGLRNVQERLRTLYAEAAEFVIRARPGGRGTEVTIVVPLHAH